MGYIADQMIEGTRCESCGALLLDGDRCYVYGQSTPQPVEDTDWGIPRQCLHCGPIDDDSS
jgi:hypothetical protein